MKKLSLNKNLIIAFFLTTMIFVVVRFYLKDILYFLSPKGYVKDHTAEKVYYIMIFLYFLSVLLLLFIAFLPKLKTYLIKLKNYIPTVNLNRGIIKKGFTIVLYAYILISPVFITGYMDISTDESTYVNTGQNLFEKGKLLYKLDNDNYVIPKDMYIPNLAMILVKPFVTYSYLVPRIVTYVFSLTLVILLVYYFKDKSRIMLVLLASTPAFIFLSGTSYAENIALIPAFLSAAYLEKFFMSRKNLHILFASLFCALATLTKVQLGIFLFVALLILAVIGYFSDKEYIPHIKVFIYSFILVFAISLLTWLLMYNLTEIKKVISLYYALSYSSVSNAESRFNLLINIERFFNFQTVFLSAVVVSYFINRKTEKSFTEKYFLIIVILNAIWFITMKGHNYRFMYYSQIGLLLLSVKPMKLILEDEVRNYRNIIRVFLLLFLIVGLIQNIKLTINGDSNEYLVYMNNNNPFKTYHVFSHDGGQKIFYDEMKKILPENETVFYIGAEAEIMGHIRNRFISFSYENYENNKDFRYIIRTAVNDQLGINQNYNSYIEEKCDLIYKHGKYSLYKIK
jgi:hypothetical protein